MNPATPLIMATSHGFINHASRSVAQPCYVYGASWRIPPTLPPFRRRQKGRGLGGPEHKGLGGPWNSMKCDALHMWPIRASHVCRANQASASVRPIYSWFLPSSPMPKWITPDNLITAGAGANVVEEVTCRLATHNNLKRGRWYQKLYESGG